MPTMGPVPRRRDLLAGDSAGGGLEKGGPKSNVGSLRGVKVASEEEAVVRIASIRIAHTAVSSA